MIRRLRELISHLASPAVSGTSLTRDTRVGLAFAAAFLIAFGFVLLRRLRTDETSPATPTLQASTQPAGSSPRNGEEGEVAVVKRSEAAETAPDMPTNLPLASVPPEVLNQIVPAAPSEPEEGLHADASETGNAGDTLQDLPGELVLPTGPVAASDSQASPDAGLAVEPALPATQSGGSEAVVPSAGPAVADSGSVDTAAPEGFHGLASEIAQPAAPAGSASEVADATTDTPAVQEPENSVPPLDVPAGNSGPGLVDASATDSSAVVGVEPPLNRESAAATASDTPIPAALAAGDPTTQEADGGLAASAVPDPGPASELAGLTNSPEIGDGAVPGSEGTLASGPTALDEQRSQAGPSADLEAPVGEAPLQVDVLASTRADALNDSDAAGSAPVPGNELTGLDAQKPQNEAQTLPPNNQPESEVGAPSLALGGQVAPARTYRVRPGDSLWTIARRVLGAGARWREIYELNRDVLKNPHRLRPGILLKLPMQKNEVVQEPGQRTTRIR